MKLYLACSTVQHIGLYSSRPQVFRRIILQWVSDIIPDSDNFIKPARVLLVAKFSDSDSETCYLLKEDKFPFQFSNCKH
jgi:hypothetical protein